MYECVQAQWTYRVPWDNYVEVRSEALGSKANNLRVLIHKEQSCEQHLKYRKTLDLSVYVQDLSRAIGECDELGYYSPIVRHA